MSGREFAQPQQHHSESSLSATDEAPDGRTNESEAADDKKHPDEWNRDLNPDRMGGQNIGEAAGERERDARTAFDVKDVHRTLAEWNDDELKQVPVLESGTRLRQGATYLDLERGQFTATGEMSAKAGQNLVPKDRVHYETWNKLIGEAKP